MKNTILVSNVITFFGCLSRAHSRCPRLLIPPIIAFGWFASFGAIPAVGCDQICDDNSNTGFGDFVLFNVTGFNNTAVGQAALDNVASGSDNTAVGLVALAHNNGSANTAVGEGALYGDDQGIASGSENTAVGFQALFYNTASNNTATGFDSLESNTSGTDNTAAGAYTLTLNTTGSRNVAIGRGALYNNQTGGDNTATGNHALYFNTASYNTAYGYQALENNNTGNNNTANGLDALNLNMSGSFNTATGAYALFNNQNAGENTATGYQALYANFSGNYNLADGYEALSKNQGFSNTAVGALALNNINGNSNIGLGYKAGTNLTSGANNIDVGSNGVAGDSGKIRIGTKGFQTNTYIVGISGVTVAGGVGVIVDANGQLGTVTSSARYKEDIKPMNEASETIFALQPVTFRYKQELDPKGIPQFGLVAEEVEKVSPDLVARDEEGKAYSVRYEAVNAMLLNEFIKEHRRNEQQEAKLSGQEKEIVRLEATVKELMTTVEKVSARLEAQERGGRLVGNR